MYNMTQTVFVDFNDDLHLICNICKVFDVAKTFKVEDGKKVRIAKKSGTNLDSKKKKQLEGGERK